MIEESADDEDVESVDADESDSTEADDEADDEAEDEAEDEELDLGRNSLIFGLFLSELFILERS